MAASSSTGKSLSSCSEDENELRRGPWTVEEDTLLTHYISQNGEGHWNLLAERSGLRRTGKSCRLRWLNYPKPDVKRGNFSLREQILILDLHLKWGRRWSKIAKHLPGRTDNEIKKPLENQSAETSKASETRNEQPGISKRDQNALDSKITSENPRIKPTVFFFFRPPEPTRKPTNLSAKPDL